MKISRIIEVLETHAPLSLQESYDNCGLQCGDPQMETEKVLCTLDCTEEVVDEAIAVGAGLIIAHHPLIFGSLKQITPRDPVQRCLFKAIRNGIAIYAIHTNLDHVKEGVNMEILRQLQLEYAGMLQPKSGILRKLTVYVPVAQTDALAKALFEAGAGHIGNYSHASFRVEGTGTFKGEEGSSPVIGTSGIYEEVRENRLEVIFPEWKTADVLQNMRTAHPYEEIAYQLSHLANTHQDSGAGMIGMLPNAMDAIEFLRMVKDSFGCGCIRHTAIAPGLKVKKIAVCGGAGRFLLKDAIRAGADLFLTSDFKYHDFFEADGRIVVADIGHFETEQFSPRLLQAVLKEKFPTFAILLSQVNTNPVNYL
jgi:dinuclear metal center YbgI/SA1388 family protein